MKLNEANTLTHTQRAAGRIPELLRAFFRQFHCLFTFLQKVPYTAVLVRVEGDLLQHVHTVHVVVRIHTGTFNIIMRNLYLKLDCARRKRECWCFTSSLNWLLSHMDLKLLLFSKSVIFIFNCGITEGVKTVRKVLLIKYRHVLLYTHQ